MKFDVPTLLLILTLCLYLAGGFIIKEDSSRLQRRSIVFTDSDGEEHEDEGLIEIAGTGYVLSYKDIYRSALPFLIISCILAKVIFNSTDEVRYMIYTNCILGLLLIWLTSKDNVLSTIFYWCGIITASYATRKITNEHDRR